MDKIKEFIAGVEYLATGLVVGIIFHMYLGVEFDQFSFLFFVPLLLILISILWRDNFQIVAKRRAFGLCLRFFKRVASWAALGAAACVVEIAPVLAQASGRANGDQFITVSGQFLLLLGALLGAGGGLRYFLEPRLQRRRFRKVMATGLWLSCYELRRHLEAIKTALAKGGEPADEMRKSLTKIPSYDYKDNPDWFVKTGYFCMITAYKIAAFSAWMKIYQTAVLRALVVARGSQFISGLFQRFDAYKVAASETTALWYDYIESVGEWMIVTEGDLASPIGFGQFCSKYKNDREFLIFFDQLHMFVHFMGRPEKEFAPNYEKVLTQMIAALTSIEKFLGDTHENLLTEYHPKERNIIEGGDKLAQAVKRGG